MVLAGEKPGVSPAIGSARRQRRLALLQFHPQVPPPVLAAYPSLDSETLIRRCQVSGAGCQEAANPENRNSKLPENLHRISRFAFRVRMGCADRKSTRLNS